jgi:hypothetical protein
MTIVNCEVDLRPRDITWEETKALLAGVPEPAEKKIDYSDIPQLTEERFARMRPFQELRAELRSKH